MGADHDPTRDTQAGPTPHGGTTVEILYLNWLAEPCPKAEAVQCEIIERDESGNEVFRTHATLTRDED